MNTFKRIMLTFCTVILLTSVLAIPANASTKDKVHTFKWTYGQRYLIPLIPTKKTTTALLILV